MFSISFYAQSPFSCANENLSTPNSTNSLVYCDVGTVSGNAHLYKPTSDDPIKKIRLKVWVMQFTAEDPLNFPDTPASRDYLQTVFDIANDILSDVERPLYGSPTPIGYPNDPNGNSHIADSRIQFAFDKNEDLVFLPDPVRWNNNNSIYSSVLFDTYGVETSYEEDCTFDIFIIGDISGPDGIGRPHYNVHQGWWAQLNAIGPNQAPSDVQFPQAFNLLHEIGHTLGLNHSWTGQFSDIQCPHCAPSGCSASCASWCSPTSDPFCLSNIMSYARTGKRNFTPLQIGNMHHSLFRESHTKYLEHDFIPGENTLIDVNTTWARTRMENAHVYIKSGATLTIKCTVYMPPTGRIIVEEGGQLIVDGGRVTVTSPHCSNYWAGVEIKGNPTANQTTANQGKVQLINEALLEYANTGVLVQSGGVIQTNNSEIKDCRYGVYFRPYEFPSLPWINFSRFINTTFSVTDDHTLDVQPFNSLVGVSGIRYRNCTFEDRRTPITQFAGSVSNYQSTGIQAINANFRVYDESTFNNLWIGIDAGNANSVRTYKVEDATFNQCFGGIINRAVMNSTMSNNHFEMGQYNVTPLVFSNDVPTAAWDGFGISIQSGSGFKIEGNTFEGHLPGNNNQTNTLGIYVNDLGGAANRIRRNSFDDVVVGNYAEGISAALFPNQAGLEYHCNLNTGGSAGASFDFFVQNGSQIAPLQGRDNKAAGNTFRSSGAAPGRNFRNSASASEISYFYFNAPAQYPVQVINTDRIQTINQNTCSEEDDGFIIAGEKELLITLLGLLQEEYLTLYKKGQLVRAEELELLSAKYQELQSASFRLLRDAFNQGESVDEEKIRNFLLKAGDRSSAYTLVDMELEDGNLTEAWTLLDTIANQLDDVLEEEQHEQFFDLKVLYTQLSASNRNWAEMSLNEAGEIENIALTGRGIAKAQARQVLNQFYGYNFLKLPPLPTVNNNLQIDTRLDALLDESVHKETPTSAMSPSFSFSPNPASDHIVFDFDWPTNQASYADLHIVDINGKVIHKHRLLAGESSYQWYPEQTYSGVFYAYLSSRGATIAPQKIVLIK